MSPPQLPGAALLAELQQALAPQIQVIREIGCGGMGTVFLGRDPSLKRLVAIKVLNPDLAHDESARVRFAREAEAAAAVGHPNVVGIFQVGVLPVSRASYFVMQFIEGQTLADAFPEGTPAPVLQARRIVGEVATALAAAHAKGLIHRDIKPANIMLDRDSGRTVVLDFGISAVLPRHPASTDPRLTQTGTSLGTPMYASPEQAAAEPATTKSDVYSLGVVAFELLCGRPPFTGRTIMELAAAHMKDAPPLVRDERPDVDPGFAHLVDACLAKDPEQRPAAASVARSLLPAAGPILEWPPPGLERLKGAGARLTSVAAAAVALAWLFLAPILLQPTRLMACCWNQPEGDSLFAALLNAVQAVIPVVLEDKDLGPLWSVIVVAAVFALPLAWVLVGRYAWRLGDDLARARQAGYPWPVALRVAWDWRADTGALLNRVDAYALLPEPDCRRFLRLRAVEQGLIGAAVLAAIATPVLWVIGGLALDPAVSADTIPGREALLLVAPPLAVLVAAAACARPEARFRRRARIGRRSRRDRSPVPVRTEVVAAWLGAAGLAPSRKRIAFPPPVLAIGAAVVITPVLLAAGLAIGATLLSSWAVSENRDRLAQWQPSSARAAWRAARAAMAQSTRLPAAGTAPLADLVPTAFLRGRWARSPIWAVDSALLARVGVDTLPLPKGFDLELRRAWRLMPGRLPDSVAAALARDTLSAGFGAWRAFAHAPPRPPLWYYRVGLPGMGRGWQLPDEEDWPFQSGLVRSAMRNSTAAVLALGRGDRVTAAIRVRENLAAGWQFLRNPGAEWPGRFVVNRGIDDLAALGRATGDSALAAESARLRAIVGEPWARAAPWSVPNGADLLFADPVQGVGLDVIADTTLAPELRWSLVNSVLWGFCHSAREVLFGISSQRRQLLERARQDLRDIPRSNDWIAVRARRLDEWIADPWAAMHAEGMESAGIFRLPALIGLRGPAARLRVCVWHA